MEIFWIVTTVQLGVATDFWQAEARDAAKYLIMIRL